MRSPRFRFLILAASIFAVAVFGTLATTRASQHPANGVWRHGLLTRINTIRDRHGLDALRLDARLNRAAQGHSDDMAKRDYFDHKTPEGKRMTDRAASAGYRWRRLMENIAAGHSDGKLVVDGWMNSPKHRDAILDPQVRDAGLGHAYRPKDGGRIKMRHYWTLLVGREN
jgi:uncharacterized protein YkwD